VQGIGRLDDEMSLSEIALSSNRYDLRKLRSKSKIGFAYGRKGNQ